jgi:hypothetical protein
VARRERDGLNKGRTWQIMLNTLTPLRPNEASSTEVVRMTKKM